jgi:hypothetical protein
MRIETELPVWPTEKYRQNGTHVHYPRMLSSSFPIDDLGKLPGNTEVSAIISRKLWIRRIDGGPWINSNLHYRFEAKIC